MNTKTQQMQVYSLILVMCSEVRDGSFVLLFYLGSQIIDITGQKF